MILEEWKTHSIFTDYAISNWGRIKRITPGMNTIIGKILNPSKNTYGYPFVNLMKNKTRNMRLVHRLVLETFIGSCPEGYVSNHKDGNKENANLWNLEYVTPSENNIHAYKNGLAKRGEQHHKAKLKESEVKQIRRLFKESNLSELKISKMFGVCAATIHEIKSGKNWGWLSV